MHRCGEVELTQFHVLVIREHQDDVGANVPAISLEAALEALVGLEGYTSRQQSEQDHTQHTQQQAWRCHPCGSTTPADFHLEEKIIRSVLMAALAQEPKK